MTVVLWCARWIHVVPPCRLPVREAKHFSVTLGDGLSHLQNDGDGAGVGGTASAAMAVIRWVRWSSCHQCHQCYPMFGCQETLDGPGRTGEKCWKNDGKIWKARAVDAWWMQWRDVGPALILHHAHSLRKPRQKRCGLCWAHTIRHYKFLPYPNNPVPFACIRELNGTASAVPAACMGLLDMSHAARVATSIANKRNISTSYNILLMCTYAHWYLCLRCTLHVKTLRALHPGGAPDILWFSAWLKIGSIQITKELSVTAVIITSKWHKMWLPLPCLALQLVQMALQGLSMLLGIAYHDLMLDSTCPMVWQTQCTATQQNHLEGLPTATSF